MGYITRFKLSTSPRIDDSTILGEAMARALGKEGDQQTIKDEAEYFDGLLDGDVEAKWYSFDEDMIKLSKELPNVLFRLYGNGEEYSDEWVRFYLNGKSEGSARPDWNPPRQPTALDWTTEKRDQAKREIVLRTEQIKLEKAERKAAKEQAEKQKMLDEINKMADQLGVTVTFNND